MSCVCQQQDLKADNVPQPFMFLPCVAEEAVFLFGLRWSNERDFAMTGAWPRLTPCTPAVLPI